MMAQQELQKYTKENTHHGINEQEILKRFIDYASACSDPENIYRYMEEKAICTFLSSYWINKAEYLASVGDYTGCFECIELAKDRREIEDDPSVDIGKKEAELVIQFMNDMRQFPLKGKRSPEEFQFTSTHNIRSDQKDNLKKVYEKILPIYEAKYGGLRKEKERLFKLARQKLPLSWLAEDYEKEEIQEKKIQEKIHENSLRYSKEVRYHSMHTPIKFRDPQRLTKTMDSVQILRKKKSTNEKLRRNRNIQKYDSDDDFEEAMEASNSKMVTSVPVGKSFSNLQRRVTFDMMELKRNVKFSDVKTSPQVKSNSSSLKNVNNDIEESFSADKAEENSEKFKSLPNPPFKMK